MGMPSRVIYLPPGVSAPSVAQPTPTLVPNAVPFDRAFFLQILPGAVGAFCQQVQCDAPVVELLTVDGTTHYVKGISGVSESWVALTTTSPEHKQAIQVFIPYQTIFRVEVHPCDNERRQLGFILAQAPDHAALHAPAVLAPADVPAIAAPEPTTPEPTIAPVAKRTPTARKR